MSSISPLPLRRSTRILMTETMSSFSERHRAGGVLALDAAVELHPADARQVVGVRVVEQPVEQGFDRVFRRRLAGTHHPVDGDAGRDLVGRVVQAQRLRDVRAGIQVVGVDGAEGAHAGFAQLGDQLLGELVVGLGQDLAGVGVDDVVRQRAADQEVLGHRDQLQPGVVHVADVLGVDPLVLGDDDLAVAVEDVEARGLALEPFRHEFHLRAFVHHLEGVEDEEVRQDLLRRHADRLQQDRDRHLAAAVDAEVQHVLGVELEVQPGATVGNDPGREQQLARAVGLAAVVLEEHARRAVQLRDDHPLGAVHHERAGGGHQGYFAHVDLLLLHLLDGGLAGLAIHDHQAHLGAQRRAEGQAALLAFLDVESRMSQHVADELQPRHVVVRRDREDRLEGGLQAIFLAAVDRRYRPAGRRSTTRAGSPGGKAPPGRHGACRSSCECAFFR